MSIKWETRFDFGYEERSLDLSDENSLDILLDNLPSSEQGQRSLAMAYLQAIGQNCGLYFGNVQKSLDKRIFHSLTIVPGLYSFAEFVKILF